MPVYVAGPDPLGSGLAPMFGYSVTGASLYKDNTPPLEFFVGAPGADNAGVVDAGIARGYRFFSDPNTPSLWIAIAPPSDPVAGTPTGALFGTVVAGPAMFDAQSDTDEIVFTSPGYTLGDNFGFRAGTPTTRFGISRLFPKAGRAYAWDFQ